MAFKQVRACFNNYLSYCYCSASPAPAKAQTGFQLWFGENKQDLEEEHPDLSEADLMVAAAKAFKELDKEEKQVQDVMHSFCARNPILLIESISEN